MKIEIERVANKEAEIKYPVLMESLDNASIAYFTSRKTAILLKAGEGNEDGEISHDWRPVNDTSIWKPFTGKVTLSND